MRQKISCGIWAAAPTGSNRREARCCVYTAPCFPAIAPSGCGSPDAAGYFLPHECPTNQDNFLSHNLRKAGRLPRWGELHFLHRVPTFPLPSCASLPLCNDLCPYPPALSADFFFEPTIRLQSHTMLCGQVWSLSLLYGAISAANILILADAAGASALHRCARLRRSLPASGRSVPAGAVFAGRLPAARLHCTAAARSNPSPR